MKVHKMDWLDGEADFAGSSTKCLVMIVYSVRLCDRKPIGEMRERWTKVTCPKCLKKRKTAGKR